MENLACVKYQKIREELSCLQVAANIVDVLGVILSILEKTKETI